MHFSYIGENSFYRLTLPEIRRLQRGYAELHKSEKSELTTPRDSDYDRLAQFKKRNMLN